tara:strand:- start:2553 stop:3131 length:579 start_codon:yes stop_codon:yes gene_type:complete
LSQKNGSLLINKEYKMPVTKKAIVVEDVLESVFSYIPDISFEIGGDEYPVVFSAGDQIALNTFLKNREQSETYPLIWMLYPFEEDHQKNRLKIDNLVLILAVPTNSTMENEERLKTTFGNVLFPLFDSIKHCLKTANIITYGGADESIQLIKYPNYSESDSKEETFANEIWDALKLTFDIEIIQTCLKPIKF